MDKEILNLYIKPDIHENKEYHALDNLFRSYQTFIKDIRIIFNKKFELNSGKTNIKYYLKFDNIEIRESVPSYIVAMNNNTSYDILVNYDAKFLKEEIKPNGKITTEEFQIQKENNINQLIIPALVCYNGTSPLGSTKIVNKKIMGGFFVTNKAVRKYMTNRKDLNNTNGKYKKQDNNFTFSFNSIPLRFKLDKIFNQFIKIELNLDNFKFDVIIDKIFIRSNILLLISFLTNYSLDEICNITINIFDENIREQCKIIFMKTKIFLRESFEGNNESERDMILRYLLYQTMTFLKVDTFSNLVHLELIRLINNFIPHLDNNFSKGVFLISIIRQFFVAMFQGDVYPGRDNMIGKRVSSVGIVFEEVIMTAISSCIKELNDKLKKNVAIPRIVSEGINLDNKINNTFINVFNMKERYTKKIIKPATSINRYYDIHVPNQVIHSGTIILTRNLNARNTEPSTISMEDPIDTPDHSENIGLIKRLGICTKIVHYNYEEQEEIFKTLKTLILDTLGYSKEEVLSLDNNRNIICSIVDSSEIPIVTITEDDVKKLINVIKEYKRNNYNNFRYIGIEKIPCYYFDNITKIYLPVEKTFQLKLNISCKRYTKPFIVVNSGNISEVNLSDYTDFTSFNKDYPDLIEYLDPGQISYSNICPDLNTFNGYSQEIKNKFDYVEITSESNFGPIATSSYSFNRMPGVRATFTVGQQKQVVLAGTSDVYNKFESGNILLNPFERPCVTNFFQEESDISIIGKGHHLLVGFFSYVDNVEDALIFRKNAIDRGALTAIRMDAFKSIVTNTLININDPKNTNNSYKKLNSKGIPDVFKVLTKRDALFKKVSLSFNKGERDTTKISDNSENYPYIIPGRVERVEKKGTDNININILTSSIRKLEPGDKVVNQCAQKGTVGIIYEDYMLPRTKDGIIPDVIINSSSIVGRQTFSLYIQAILTKLYGEFPINKNGELIFREFPIFTNTSIEDIISSIENEYKSNYPDLTEEEIENKMFGNEIMYDYFGNKIKSLLMVCPLMYNRSNQTSVDNINVRDIGRLNKNGIPVSGKKKGGGQRYGEMENDVIIAHGSSNILQEISKDVETNKTVSKFCDNCFTPATKERINNQTRWYCIPCESQNLITDIKNYELTQASKLLLEGLCCRGIKMKIKNKEQPIYYSFDSVN